ncbi:hypothetical protein [Pseudofulvibacter geojedonensis]|uniref:Uncharacterized protein n=1 Tax=Pseudofulvibacter geojedonensis TaxID=1123758 RepID=A0ABW3I5Z7_9FLAO
MKLVFTFLTLIPFFIFGQNDLPKREAFELNLPLGNGKFYQYKVPQSNYFVYKTDLQIYPTEEIFIEIELNGSRIISMKTVKEKLNPSKTLIVSFNQETKNGKSNIMVLKVHNPFPLTLNYSTLIHSSDSKKWKLHKPYKVSPLSNSYEMFNTPLVTIVLKNWKFQ